MFLQFCGVGAVVLLWMWVACRGVGNGKWWKVRELCVLDGRVWLGVSRANREGGKAGS